MKLAAILWTAAVASLAVTASANATETLSGNLTADNAFFAYISTSDSTLGALVASGSDFHVDNYAIPTTSLAEGTNFLHIEVINFGGPGGFIGSFNVGGTTLLTNTTQWKGVYNNSNFAVTPQPWIMPTAAAEAVTDVWAVYSPIDTSATWIFAGGTATNGCQNLNGGYCTIDLSVQLTPTLGGGVPSGVPEVSTWVMMLAGLVGLGVVGHRRNKVSTLDA